MSAKTDRGLGRALIIITWRNKVESKRESLMEKYCWELKVKLERAMIILSWKGTYKEWGIEIERVIKEKVLVKTKSNR